MRCKCVTNKLTCVLLALFIMLPLQVVNGGFITHAVVIDTTSISGTAGDIEFQLGAAGDGVPITTSITAYASDATLDGPTGFLIPPDPPFTTMSGDLIANTLSLFNDDSASQIADADQLVSSFGAFMSFFVTLSGDSIGAPSMSTPTFAIFVYSGGTPLGNGPLGEVVTFQVQTDGSVVVTNDGSVSEVSPVAEPSTITSFGIGIVGVALAMRRNRSLSSSV